MWSEPGPVLAAGAGFLYVARHAEDVERPKPAPGLYLAACARLGAEPGRCVAFEDSRTGVASAKAAGLYVIGVPSLAGVATGCFRRWRIRSSSSG